MIPDAVIGTLADKVERQSKHFDGDLKWAAEFCVKQDAEAGLFDRYLIDAVLERIAKRP